MEHAPIPWETWVVPDIKCKLFRWSVIIRKLRTVSFVFCDEDESPWPNTCSGFTGAYTWWKQWNYWSVSFIKQFLVFFINESQVYLYVVLCPDVYFSSTNLADQLRAVRDEPSKATTINNIYWNKGHIWFHER